MGLIHWGSALQVGHTAMDAQHEKLVGLLNALDTAVKQDNVKKVIGKIFYELNEYTFSHFIMEERLMHTHAYPDQANHIRAHTQLKTNVEKYQEDLAAGNPALTLEVMGFLADWWSNHIMVTDRALGAFLASKNLT